MDGSACLLRRYCRHCRARLPVWLLIHRCMALHPVVLDRLIFTLYFSISSFRQSSLPWMAARWIADKPCKNIPNAPIYNMFSNSFVPCYILVCIGFYKFFLIFLIMCLAFTKTELSNQWQSSYTIDNWSNLLLLIFLFPSLLCVCIPYLSAFFSHSPLSLFLSLPIPWFNETHALLTDFFF